MQYSVNYKDSDTDVEVFLTEPGLRDISDTAAANEPIEFTIKNRVTIELRSIIKPKIK